MKRILFVCVENAGRSQMAEAFARTLGKGQWEPYSAGSRPSGHLNPLVVEVMKEADIDLSQNVSKGFSDLPVTMWHTVITMGCGDQCVTPKADRILDWALADPKGKDIQEVRRIRDQIRELVTDLFRKSSRP